MATDVRERRFVEHTLQIAIQACQDVASHIVSDDRLGEPRTNQELFDLLVAAGRLDAALGVRPRRAVAVRNILVHGYDAVDPHLVREALSSGLDDLLLFSAAVRSTLPPGAGEP